MPNIRISKSAKLYMQRKAPHTQETLRSDGPRMMHGLNPARFAAVGPPIPSIAVDRALGASQPDVGATGLWPAGEVLVSR